VPFSPPQLAQRGMHTGQTRQTNRLAYLVRSERLSISYPAPFCVGITQLDFERDRVCGSKFTLDFQLRFRALDRGKKSTV
jgi:hypothetical protein